MYLHVILNLYDIFSYTECCRIKTLFPQLYGFGTFMLQKRTEKKCILKAGHMISPSCSWEFIREVVIFDSWTNQMGQIFSMNTIHKTNKSDWSGSRVQLNEFFDYLTIWFRKTLNSMLYGPHLWYLYGALASFSKPESLSSHGY